MVEKATTQLLRIWLVFLLFSFPVQTLALSAIPGNGIFANIRTNQGDILVKLHHEKVPRTVRNFIGLAEGTVAWIHPRLKIRMNSRLYRKIRFHRVIKDFMIQTGAPLSDGKNSPGYQFADEIHAELKHNKPGIVSMANSGPNTNGSQFFITHKATPWLDGKHSVFGEVVNGMDVVNKIKMDDVLYDIQIHRKGEAAKMFEGPQKGIFAKIITTQGTVTARLFYKKAPFLVRNFMGLAEGTIRWKDPVSQKSTLKPYYQDLPFHRVDPGFMIQTGKPNHKGAIGPGYIIEYEFHPSLHINKPGMISMAFPASNPNAGQFFITQISAPWLNGIHPVFGEVIHGMEVVRQIKQKDRLLSIVIIRKGRSALLFNGNCR